MMSITLKFQIVIRDLSVTRRHREMFKNAKSCGYRLRMISQSVRRSRNSIFSRGYDLRPIHSDGAFDVRNYRVNRENITVVVCVLFNDNLSVFSDWQMTIVLSLFIHKTSVRAELLKIIIPVNVIDDVLFTK